MEKTVDIQLAELREQIAQEIEESGHLEGCYRTPSNRTEWNKCNCGLDRHAAIARGQK